MKRLALYLGIVATLAASCTVQEMELKTFEPKDGMFYATFEQPGDAGTRVYANEDLLLRWTADDRVSIFNKITCNQEYKFLGETGDNGGGFNRVDHAEFVTGNAIPNIVSVYPYRESTRISEEEVLTLTLPAEQKYAENTFGLGANTMVSVSSDNVLMYKNVGGYLKFRFYGNTALVTSVTLKGNNGEQLAGKAFVTMPLDGVPSVTLDESATKQITLVCDRASMLGQTAEEATDFWFVLPPVTFSKGFTVTITGNGGSVVTKSTDKAITIERNTVSKMSPMEVTLPHPNNILFYTSQDGKIDPNNSGDFGAVLVNNEYVDGLGVLTFDGNVTHIPDIAFLGKSLTSISLPESVTAIGQSAFASNNLTSINLPQGVTTIEQGTFNNCRNLTSIVFPNNLVSIGDNAFGGCLGLTSIVFPEHLASLGKGAFSGCKGLTSVTIPQSIVNIGPYPFGDNPNLESIVVEASNPVYDSRENCNAIIETYNNVLVQACKNTVIPDSVVSIGEYAFGGCPGLTSVTIPSGMTQIDPTSFSGCSGIESITVATGNSVYDSRNNCNAIIETATNTLVAGCKNTVIPASVSAIGPRAFLGCTELTSITLPQRVTTIGEYAFGNCSGLTELVIPPLVTSIGESAFTNCSGLASVTISGNITSIEPRAFSWCTSLKSITLPQSVSSIGDWAFSGCTSLESISLPRNLSSIGQWAFSRCSSLKSISLPQNLSSIGSGAFADCTTLTEMTIPQNVTRISGAAFMGCTSLESVSLPESLKTIEGQLFQECSSLTEISIPQYVTEIGHDAFNGCTSLASVTIPESVYTIGNGAFGSCTSLTSITIPKNVSQMDWAFVNCTNLETVTVLPYYPPRASYAFRWFDEQKENDKITIYVPEGRVDAYKSADYWSDYADRITAIQE